MVKYKKINVKQQLRQSNRKETFAKRGAQGVGITPLEIRYNKKAQKFHFRIYEHIMIMS